MREVKGKKYKGSFILKIALFCFVGFFVVTLVNQQIQIADKQAEKEELQLEREAQDLKNEELEKTLEENVGIDTYAEEYARKEYNFAMPQERIFINVGGQEAEE